MESKIKILTALAIPYFFLCAGLYQMAFWTPFSINIFSYLDIADIIKSFIYPFLITSFGAIVINVIQFGPNFDILPYGGGNKEPHSKGKALLWIAIRLGYFFLVLYLVLIYEDKWKGTILPWILVPAFSFSISEFLLRNKIMGHEKNNFFAIYLLSFLPAYAFSSGTFNAKKIYQNSSFEYSTLVLPEKPLKFLGKASNYYIFVSLNNSDKYFFSVDEIKGLKLKEFKR